MSRFRSRLSRTAAVLAVCLLPLSACGGGAERQKEAEAIAKAIEDYMATLQDPTQKAGLQHDKVTVTPSAADKSYAVAVTGIKFADATGAGFNIGEIDYTLTPAEGETYQVGGLKLPAQMTAVGSDGKPTATFAFENTAFSGVWSPALQNFLKLDWQAKNLTVTDAQQPDMTAKAGALSLVVDSKESGKDRLDQTADFNASDIAVAAPGEDVDFSLAKAGGKLDILGFDAVAYRQQMLRLKELTMRLAPKAEQAAAGGAAPAVPAEMTDADRKALSEIVAALPKTMSGYHYTFNAEGLVVKSKDGTTPARLAQGGMEFALKGLDGDKAEFDFGLKHDGLELSGGAFEEPLAKAVLPKSGSLALAATEIPVATLVDALAQQIPQLTSADPQTAKGAEFALMGALMSALSQSKIKLDVQPSHLTAARAALTVDGTLQLALSSPVMAVGTLNFALTGLDDLMALANDFAARNPEGMQAVGMLQMLQAMAKRESGADGKPVDKLILDLAPAGAITVNGKPLDGLAP